jgi:hypothetical protein
MWRTTRTSPHREFLPADGVDDRDDVIDDVNDAASATAIGRPIAGAVQYKQLDTGPRGRTSQLAGKPAGPWRSVLEHHWRGRRWTVEAVVDPATPNLTAAIDDRACVIELRHPTSLLARLSRHRGGIMIGPI